ncbi:hypothetical protein K491DRAFT_439834 [Lophiostoma macrostomum CBS 122681]|uniref:Uncharacterized protein n=1 Tax=Lophiostoma macrostomum CBS 122681 TaxID=1314788 RepID=A0A6A6T814_9PLEO|nr:hypothetical protein K491DRAFT_439834 [Lophiostoma macrostomum CBS 122681]
MAVYPTSNIPRARMAFCTFLHALLNKSNRVCARALYDRQLPRGRESGALAQLRIRAFSSALSSDDHSRAYRRSHLQVVLIALASPLIPSILGLVIAKSAFTLCARSAPCPPSITRILATPRGSTKLSSEV